jgi:hypothetical protein
MSAVVCDPAGFLHDAAELVSTDEAGGSALAWLACQMTRPGRELLTLEDAASAMQPYAARCALEMLTERSHACPA